MRNDKLTLQQQQVSKSKIVSATEEEIENGLDFLLSHFEQPVIFPRNMMATELINQKKYQHFKIVYSKEETLSHFKKYNFVDCRINAFPSLKEGVTWKPELLFIDLDLADFKSIKSLELALNKTKKNIQESLNGIPTIIGSGNGYHIIQPVECPIISEKIEQFSKYNNPSQEFLRFAKDFLSNGKADKAHHPSFNSCLLRAPGSINSKCLDNRDKRLSGNIKVKTIQKWNGVRAPITREFIEDFRTYLEQKITDQENNIATNNNRQRIHYNNTDNNNSIEWIEKLLQTPIADYRKNTVSLILAPYLINIKKSSYSESFEIINEWLSKCNDLNKLDQRFDNRIKRSLKTAIEKKIPPMKLETLREKNGKLYYLLKIK
jgi:hypothetical protein